MIKTKHSLTLIEVLVGFALFAVLMTALMMSFKSISLNHAHIQSAGHHTAAKRHAFYTLSYFFDKIVDRNTSTLQIESTPFGPRLSFISGEHIDRDPLFYGERLIQLYRENRQLILAQSSLKNSNAVRKTILYDEIDHFDLSFLYPDPTLKTGIAQYKKTWVKGSIPFAIELQITRHNQPTSLTLLTPPDLQPRLGIPLENSDKET
ncbi:MAG: prepilin-type N-terminal cleavage/methylation domain-containing protein [Simkaniaceae bacterium]|nr:prepilin-type N-terminal cleavage/methylation domain-containing protein [Simkaniaceae bacterium]